MFSIATSSALRPVARSALASSSRRAFSSSPSSLASTLLFVEHRKGEINPTTLSALTAAQKLGGDIHAAVVGSADQIEGVADAVAK